MYRFPESRAAQVPYKMHFHWHLESPDILAYFLEQVEVIMPEYIVAIVAQFCVADSPLQQDFQRQTPGLVGAGEVHAHSQLVPPPA